VSDNGQVVADVDLANLQWGTNAVNKSILTGINDEGLTQSEVEAPSWYSDLQTSLPHGNGRESYADRVTWNIHTTFNDGIHGLGWEATTDLIATCPANPEAYVAPASATPSVSASN